MTTLPSLLVVLALAPAHALEFDLTAADCGPGDWVDYCPTGGACSDPDDLQGDLITSTGSLVCARFEGDTVDLYVPANTQLVMRVGAPSTLTGTSLPALQLLEGAAAFVYVEGKGASLELQGGPSSLATLNVVSGGELYLQGATLTAMANQQSPPIEGGVVYVGPDSRVELVGVDIHGGTATYGGGIFAETDSELELVDVDFFDNGAEEQGGDVMAVGSLIVSDSRFSQTAVAAGVAPDFGGSVYAMGDVTISGSTFYGRSVDKGGAVYATGTDTTITIDDSSFIGGEAVQRGGAIYLRGDITSELRDLTFDGVTEPMESDGRGGAVFVDGILGGGDVSIERGTVTGASAARGGAFGFLAVGAVTVDRVTFQDTTATVDGGAIHSEGVVGLTVVGSAFCDVSAASVGGAMHAEGALLLTVSNVLVRGAEAQSGAAISATNSLTLLGQSTFLDVGDPFLIDGGFMGIGQSVLRLTVPVSQVNPVGYFVPADLWIEDSIGSVDLSDPYGVGIRVEPLVLLGGEVDPAALPCGEEFRLHPLGASSNVVGYGPRLDDDWGVMGGGTEALPSADWVVSYGADPDVLWSDDEDGDGWPLGVDCDDSDATVSPGATEDCSPVDHNCNGVADDISGEVDGAMQVYVDSDGDGYAPPGADQVWVCDTVPPLGTSLETTDCDDANVSVFPGALETCGDGIDQDCGDDGDGGIPAFGEGDELSWDADGDGYLSDSADVQSFCEAPVVTTGGQWIAKEDALGAGDCEDTDPLINPGAMEVCDRIDNNCDGATDEGFVTEWLLDVDGDGVPAAGEVLDTCVAPEDGVPADGVSEFDCDDANPNLAPGLPEVCDGADNDCDTEVDEGTDQLWYLDQDGDGYAGTVTVQGCDAPPGGSYIPEAEALAAPVDCDDDDPRRSPGEREVCNEIDDDCDLEVDETVGDDQSGAVAYWPDADADGFGAATVPTWACEGRLPPGAALNDADCDDADASVHPDSTEVLGNQIDENCDDYLGDQWAGGGGGLRERTDSAGFVVGTDEWAHGGASPTVTAGVSP